MAQIRIAGLQLVEIAGREALDHEVGLVRQAREELPAFGFFQVERDAALVVVEAEPGEAFFRVGLVLEKRPEPPRRVAAGALDLHHVGAEVAEYFAREKAQLVGEIEHAEGG